MLDTINQEPVNWLDSQQAHKIAIDLMLSHKTFEMITFEKNSNKKKYANIYTSWIRNRGLIYQVLGLIKMEVHRY